jgi:CelD/BcsL family acetyltransferase involved in cellulose biosynthesis
MRISQLPFDSLRNDPALQRRWDRLWNESQSCWPLSRWEQIELWHGTFTPKAAAAALVIESGDRWVAGLPLVRRRWKGLFPFWDLPYDDWSGALELLVARDTDRDPEVYDAIVAGLSKMGLPLCRLAHFAAEAPANAGLGDALVRNGRGRDIVARHDIGVIDFEGPNAPASWKAYQDGWSGNFRRQMRKMTRRAEELGGVELAAYRPESTRDVTSLLKHGFEIEDRSWKGRAGTSIVRARGMADYFTRHAELLAARGELMLLFLKFQDEPIAFEFGYSCRRVYFSPKIGFDERFSHLSPGQLLRYLWVEQLFADRSHARFDFAGPLVEATEKWATSRYRQSRLLVGTSPTGRGLIRVHRAARGLYRQTGAALQRCRSHWEKLRAPRLPTQQGASAS